MSLRVNFDADYGYKRTMDNFKLYTSPMDIGNININIWCVPEIVSRNHLEININYSTSDI